MASSRVLNSCSNQGKGVVIALSGWRGSGKDLVANHLVEKYGFVRVAFADALKDMVSKKYQINRGKFDDPVYKNAPILSYPVYPRVHDSELALQSFFANPGNGTMYWTARALLAHEGNNTRKVDELFWVKEALGRVFKEQQGQDVDFQTTPNKGCRTQEEIDSNQCVKVVISDARFVNEVEWIRKLERENKLEKTWIWRINRFVKTDDSCASERQLDDYTEFDLVLDNRINQPVCMTREKLLFEQVDPEMERLGFCPIIS